MSEYLKKLILRSVHPSKSLENAKENPTSDKPICINGEFMCDERLRELMDAININTATTEEIKHRLGTKYTDRCINTNERLMHEMNRELANKIVHAKLDEFLENEIIKKYDLHFCKDLHFCNNGEFTGSIFIASPLTSMNDQGGYIGIKKEVRYDFSTLYVSLKIDYIFTTGSSLTIVNAWTHCSTYEDNKFTIKPPEEFSGLLTYPEFERAQFQFFCDQLIPIIQALFEDTFSDGWKERLGITDEKDNCCG
jgi:hypothetical protein